MAYHHLRRGPTLLSYPKITFYCLSRCHKMPKRKVLLTAHRARPKVNSLLFNYPAITLGIPNFLCYFPVFVYQSSKLSKYWSKFKMCQLSGVTFKRGFIAKSWIFLVMQIQLFAIKVKKCRSIFISKKHLPPFCKVH